MKQFKVGDAVKVYTGGTFPEYGKIVKMTKLSADVEIEGCVCRFKKTELNWD